MIKSLYFVSEIVYQCIRKVKHLLPKEVETGLFVIISMNSFPGGT